VSEISVTTHTILILTFKFIFICILISPEMVTTFNTENVVNQSKKAPCKHRTGHRTLHLHKNKLHLQIHASTITLML